MYEALVEKVKRCDYFYYVRANPLISDYEYDQLVKRIEAIENQHPEWRGAFSPTNTVASDLQEGFSQKEHSHPMLSLANTYSKKDLSDFLKRIEKRIEKEFLAFTVELKIDGVAVSVYYEEGELVRSVTRGDGRVGDDVTKNVKTIEGLPWVLKGDLIPKKLDLRGEVFMPIAIFQQLNRDREKKGEPLYANPRNAAAGALKLLDPKKAQARKLSILIYDMVEGGDLIKKQSEVRVYLEKLGLPVFSKDQCLLCKREEEIVHFANEVEKKRESFLFEIDGVVIKLDDFHRRDLFGYTGKSPRWAVAYKFSPKRASTIVERIDLQVGRTGVLTPIAQVTPTPLSGSTICRATLHNQDEINRKDIRVGDVVFIEKGGDVIPKIVSVDIEKRTEDLEKWRMPSCCPSCGHVLVQKEEKVAMYCPNPFCKGRILQKISFFVAKDALDIAHLGKGIIEKLLDLGLVKTVSDMYRLTWQHLSKVDGFQEKSIYNLLKSIESSKKTTLARFIFALGIAHIGKMTAEVIADRVDSVEAFLHLTEESLVKMEGIGPIAAKSIVEFLQDTACVKEVYQLLQAGVFPKKEERKEGDVSGRVFVLTGTLTRYSRTQATQLIKQRGGKVAPCVSKKTDYLILGKDPGSKRKKAETLGVRICEEEAFIQMLS